MSPPLPEEVDICGCFANQPIGEFFVGVVPAAVLCAIAYTDIRRLDSREVEMYSGLNRPVNPTRVREISEYVETAEATFPNSIIIAIRSQDIKRQSNNSLTIRVGEDVAKIIDGQHRISGLKEAHPEKFELVVSIFVDLAVEDQAAIFSTINLKQTRVDKSLVYDLFDLSTERSPEKTCHDIAKSMNSDKASPFFERIKLLGRNPALLTGEVLYKAPLTQAAFVKHLLPMISDNPEKDKDLIKRGQEIVCPPDAVQKGMIFCEFFRSKDDATIVRVLNNYFQAVQDTFPDQWNNYDNPLSKTIGYGALMRLLKDDLFPIGLSQKKLTKEFFANYLSRAKGKIRLSFDTYAPAGSGESNLYRDFRKWVVESA